MDTLGRRAIASGLEAAGLEVPPGDQLQAVALAAILYSFVGNCKRLGADPFAYLKDVLGRLPTQPADRLVELLPDAWFAAHPNTRRKVAS
jgi:hypothetical protein